MNLILEYHNYIELYLRTLLASSVHFFESTARVHRHIHTHN